MATTCRYWNYHHQLHGDRFPRWGDLHFGNPFVHGHRFDQWHRLHIHRGRHQQCRRTKPHISNVHSHHTTLKRPARIHRLEILYLNKFRALGGIRTPNLLIRRQTVRKPSGTISSKVTSSRRTAMWSSPMRNLRSPTPRATSLSTWFSLSMSRKSIR